MFSCSLCFYKDVVKRTSHFPCQSLLSTRVACVTLIVVPVKYGAHYHVCAHANFKSHAIPTFNRRNCSKHRNNCALSFLLKSSSWWKGKSLLLTRVPWCSHLAKEISLLSIHTSTSYFLFVFFLCPCVCRKAPFPTRPFARWGKNLARHVLWFTNLSYKLLSLCVWHAAWFGQD